MKTFTTTITSKGQMTLPVAFRRKLGIKPGEQVSVKLTGNKVFIQKNNWQQELNKLHEEVATHLKKHNIKPLSDEELDKAIDEAGQQAALKRYQQHMDSR